MRSYVARLVLDVHWFKREGKDVVGILKHQYLIQLLALHYKLVDLSMTARLFFKAAPRPCTISNGTNKCCKSYLLRSAVPPFDS